MSKNISNLSGRIGLKNNLFEKISERSLNSKDSSGIKEIAFTGGITPDILKWLSPKFEPFIVNVKNSAEYGAILHAESATITTKNNQSFTY